MEETADRPKWLLELENRKRKPRLAHEAGAGSPCTVCNSACPGLDLHFWRKICKNCKCSRDDHDVDDDEFPQFDLLFGPSGKFKKKSMLLRVNKKQHEAETAFEWVPPDTTKELAADYMKALPIEKLPIKGSAGAILRRQLLQKQLPLHDIDHKVCDELSEPEKRQFEKYLENLKKYVGQGKVTKILAARPFDRSLMTPINATDMQRLSPQHKHNIPSTGVQLRTPSSFTTKSPYTKSPYERLNKQEIPGNPELELNPPDSARYDPVLTTLPNDGTIVKSEPIESTVHTSSVLRSNITSPGKQTHLPNPEVSKSMPYNLVNSPTVKHVTEQKIIPSFEAKFSENSTPLKKQPLKPSSLCPNSQSPMPQHSCTSQEYKDTVKNPNSCIVQSEKFDSETVRLAESMLADALLPPSAIHANDIIGSTLDEKRLMFIREKLTDKYSSQENPVIRGVPKVSQELSANNSLQRVNHGPKKSNDLVNADKEAERTAIISGTRNPSGVLTDLEDKLKEKVARLKQEKEMYKPLSQIIQSTPLEPLTPSNNNQKGKLIQPVTTGVLPSTLQSPNKALRNSDDPQIPIYSTHPEYLQTLSVSPSSSLQLPTDVQCLQAELNTSSIQPIVIHSEDLQNQIFSHEAVGQVVQNMPNMEHLKGAMEGLRVDSVKTQKCNKCREDIRVGDVAVIAEKAKNASWHPGCFVCSVCNELLVDLVYFYYKNKLYCGRDLASLLGIPRCFACDELIFVREYTVAEGHNYHVKHFCCWDCDVPLAGQQYITENDRPLCLPCYQKSYAKTCNGCNVVIAADQQGVAIKNLNFHATEICFSCYSCKKNLLNSRMAVKEDKLFCSKECISKFLNR